MSREIVTFRTAAEVESDFLVSLYGTTRQDELALTRREAFIRSQFTAQRSHYRSRRPEGREELILVDGTAAGRLYSDLGGDTDHILDLSLLPEYRGRGIGSRVLEKLLTGAMERERRVTVKVESISSARAFFERHGFATIAGDDFHFLLKWRPARESAPEGVPQGG